MTELAHAILGASGSKKWLACTMAPAVERGIPDEESEYSAEGTCAHAVAEARLRNWIAGKTVSDETQVKDYDKFLNQDFSDHVDTYVTYVIDRHTVLADEHGADNVQVMLEQRLDFSRWVPEGFGTADAVLLFPGGLEIVDLKFGAGVRVDGVGNPQLRLYALGGLARFEVVQDFTEVAVAIVQPRMDNITGETMQVQDLLTWADELVEPRAKIAWAAYNGDRREARFSPGEHCSTGFCKARFTCAARARYMLESAEQPYSLDEPDTLTTEQLEKVVERADLAVKWLSDCKRYLIQQAATGKVELHKYELVEGRSTRTITDEAEAARILMHNGYAAADIYAEPRLRGLVQLEKLVGKKQFADLLSDVLEKPAGKPTLAPRGSGKAKVAPRSSSAAADFHEFDD